MSVFLVLFLIFLLTTAKVRRNGSFNSDYLSKEKTTAVKGIFTVLVFMTHFMQYIKPDRVWDGLYLAVNRHLGQMVVAMFLFCSGYGIVTSIRKKGKDYVLSLPKRRILPLWISFSTVIVLYLILAAAIGKQYPLRTILLAFTGWESVGNSNWYVFTILMLYFLTYVSFLAGGRNARAPFIPLTLLTALTVLMAVLELIAGRPSYFYSTVLLYPFGAWYTLFKERTDRFVMRDQKTYLTVLVAGLFVYPILSALRRTAGIPAYFAWEIAFACLVLLITMKVSWDSRLLNWLGTHVFGIYILQRIPMILLKQTGLIRSHPYVSFLIAFAATVVLAGGFAGLQRDVFAGKPS